MSFWRFQWLWLTQPTAACRKWPLARVSCKLKEKRDRIAFVRLFKARLNARTGTKQINIRVQMAGLATSCLLDGYIGSKSGNRDQIDNAVWDTPSLTKFTSEFLMHAAGSMVKRRLLGLENPHWLDR